MVKAGVSFLRHAPHDTRARLSLTLATSPLRHVRMEHRTSAEPPPELDHRAEEAREDWVVRPLSSLLSCTNWDPEN